MSRLNHSPVSQFLIIFFAIILFGCQRHSEAWSKLEDAEAIMHQHPDSALAVLSDIDKSMLRGKEEKARYALLKSQALDKNYIDTTTFDVLQPAIDYYLKKGSPDERLKTLYYQGRIYQNRQDKDSAMLCFLHAEDYARGAKDTLSIANLYVAQATILYQMYKFDEFIQKNLDAAHLYHRLGREDYEILSLANALDGYIQQRDENHTDSIMSIAIDRVRRNPEFAATLYPYILIQAIQFGDREDIEEALNYYNSIDSVDDMAKVDVAFGYDKINDIANAKRTISLIDSTSDVRNSLKYLSVASEILEKSGDYREALEAYRSFYNKLDSIHQNIFSNAFFLHNSGMRWRNQI